MAITEQIQQYVDRLPPPLQQEALVFVEHLLAQSERDRHDAESEAWGDLSLKAAMRGMESEQTPAYTAADLKSVF